MLVVLPLVLVCFGAADGLSISDPERLYRQLFSDYVIVRPVQNWWETVHISSFYSLFQLKSLDGKTQVLETMGTLNLAWVDSRLQWNVSEYNDMLFMDVSARKIWTPVIGLWNSADEVVDSDWTADFPALILYNGFVWWQVHDRFYSSCDLNMLLFPFDTQYCSLEFGNLVHIVEMVNMSNQNTVVPTEIDLVFYEKSKEFDVVSTWIELFASTDSIRGIGYSGVKYWLRLKRRPEYYVINIIIPTVWLAILSSFTFYAPVECGEKLSLSITVLLSFTIFLLIISEKTPQTSGPTPFLSIYLTVVISLSAMSVVVQILILRMYHTNTVDPVPRWLQKLTRRFESCTSRRHASCKGGHTSSNLQQRYQYRHPEVRNAGPSRDRNVTSDKEVYSTDTHLKQHTHPHELFGSKQRKLAQSPPSHTLDRPVMSNDSSINGYKEDWHKTATVLDNTLFVIFVVVHCVMACLVLLVIPAFAYYHQRSDSSTMTHI